MLAWCEKVGEMLPYSKWRLRTWRGSGRAEASLIFENERGLCMVRRSNMRSNADYFASLCRPARRVPKLRSTAMSLSSLHSREPLSAATRKVQVSGNCGSIWPVHRTEKLSPLVNAVPAGIEVPQSKSTVASVREVFCEVKSYSS